MGIIAGGVFVFLLVFFYSLYGEEFLNETYFYHFTRKDNRHSFSPFFYDIYLFLRIKTIKNVTQFTFLSRIDKQYFEKIFNILCTILNDIWILCNLILLLLYSITNGYLEHCFWYYLKVEF